MPVSDPAEYFRCRGVGSSPPLRPASGVWNLRDRRGLEGMLIAPLPPTGVGGRESVTPVDELFHIERAEPEVPAQ